MHTPKVGLVWLDYNALRYLPDVVRSWEKLSYPREALTVYIVGCLSPDNTSSLITADVLPRSGKDLPTIRYIDTKANGGFAINNNAGIQASIQDGAAFVFLQNGDLVFAQDAIQQAVKLADSDPTIGAVQSTVCYWYEHNKVNTTGGVVHVAGYGFARDNGRQLANLSLTNGEEISYASGAAVLYRVSALQKVGMLEEGFFMYHEDLELGLRLKIAGYRSVLSTQSFAYHDYKFGRNQKMFAWMELYRIVVLLAFLRIPSLLLLAPLLIAIEAGTWLMAAKGGWLSAKVYAMRQWLRPATWGLVWRMRRRAQRLRVIDDTTLTRLWTGKIEHQETSNPFMDRLVNPVIDALWRIVHRVMIW